MSTVLPGELGEGKIQGWHRDRLAVVYVRQSSRQQVAGPRRVDAAAVRADRPGGRAGLACVPGDGDR